MTKHCNSRIECGLSGVTTCVQRVSPGEWRFSHVNGTAVAGRARRADGWLELTIAVPDAAHLNADPISWLRFNERLGGSVRAARALGVGGLHLRTDLMLRVQAETNLEDRIASSADQLTAAFDLLEPTGGALPPRDSPHGSNPPSADVGQLAAEAGWPCTIHSATDIRVDIATKAGVFAARLDSARGGAARLVVEVSELTGQSAPCRRAVAMLLLVLSSAVRSVKGVVVERDNSEFAALAAVVEDFTAKALDRSLSALAVACQISAREVQALRNERLAGKYLALWDAAPRCDSHTTEEERSCLQLL